ncbi:MAG: PAS domain S-box protein [Bacteroidetes bacterium]|nr:PAS domain S-box protein [Bacteroidota bacterium]
MILSLLLVTNSAFSDSSNEIKKSDSNEVIDLCDSAIINIDDYNSSITFARKANQIAFLNKIDNCLAESEFTLGTVFFQHSLYDSALIYFKDAFPKYSKIKNETRIIETLEFLSRGYTELYDFKESINYALIGVSYSDSLELIGSEGKFYFYLGYCYEELGLYQKAVDALNSALRAFESVQDSAALSSTLINIGIIFSRNENFSDAYDYTARALAISTKLNDKKAISICLNNIGDIYSLTHEYNKALEYFKRTLEINRELDDTEGVAISLNNIGDSYRNLKDTVLAISYYSKSINTANRNNYPSRATPLASIGDIYLKKGELKLALKNALESLDIAVSSNISKNMLSSYELLHKIYSAMGKYENSYNYLVKYRNLYDSTYSVTKSKHILEVKAKYDDEKQKSEITSLKEKSTNETKRRTNLMIIIAITLLVIIIMLIINILYRRSRRLVYKQKQYYEKLLERSEDFIFVISKDGKAKYISPSYERKVGREINSRIGKSVFEFVHPDDIEFVKKEFAALVKDKKPRSIDFRMQTETNGWVYVQTYGQNLIGDGAIDGIVVNFWDITQRKKNEELIKESELRFREIFNAFPDIYFQADLRGKIIEISPSVTKLTGFTREEIIGVTSKKYDNYISDWEKIGAELESNYSVHDYDTQVTTKDGNILHCSLSAEMIFSEENNAPMGIKGVIRDISSRVKNQKSLSDSETKLKEANQSKEKLFSIIAHDLIGPIGTNKSIVDLIVSQVDELSHEEIVTLISSLKPSLDSTYALIDNLLSWARIQQHQLKPSPELISLNKLVQEMVELLKDQAIRKSIIITIASDKPVTIFVDKNQLGIAIRNLISNAIKFSYPESEILVTISSTDELAEVKISDSGIGMTKTQIDNVLAGKGSTEVRRGTDNEKGTGFGLVIVNEFVKNNNGVLKVASKKGEGSTFTVSFPI